MLPSRSVLYKEDLPPCHELSDTYPNGNLRSLDKNSVEAILEGLGTEKVWTPYPKLHPVLIRSVLNQMKLRLRPS